MYYSFHNQIKQLFETCPFEVRPPKQKRFICQVIFHRLDGDKKLSLRADNCGPYLQYLQGKSGAK
jgi:hypothetical protein